MGRAKLLHRSGDEDSPAEERFVAKFKADRAKIHGDALFALTNSANRSHRYVTLDGTRAPDGRRRDHKRDLEIERIVQDRRLDELAANGYFS